MELQRFIIWRRSLGDISRKACVCAGIAKTCVGAKHPANLPASVYRPQLLAMAQHGEEAPVVPIVDGHPGRVR